MSGYSWRYPFALACQPCLRKRVYTLDEAERSEHKRRACVGIVRTGKVGRPRGRYNRPTAEVQHKACGHVWMTTHFSVQDKP